MNEQIRFRKLWLNLNGVDRMCICNPKNDTLADVVRRFGLTGTKVGCGTGVCGSCSIILNGKLVRSCTLKIKNVEQFSKVITIEGIGGPSNLHPLQQAWITYGGVQCGFCSPGFIVSSYALLQENQAPTREEVRDWFTKHRNICRCTGYKPLVDSVMAAAKVMRGEATMKDITFKHPEDGEYYGKAVPRPDALAKVCGLCDYGDDIAMKMPTETLHVAIVQPKITSHANILSIDYSGAEKMPGVQCVLTAKDVKGDNSLVNTIFHKRTTINNPPWPIICDKKIYNYGCVVALVCADSRDHARAAAQAVRIEIEQLPEHMSYLDSCIPDALRIHENSPNIFIQQPLVKGNYRNVPDMIDKAPLSVSGSFSTTREPHLSIEGDTVQVYWDEDDLLTIQCKSQDLAQAKSNIASAIGIPSEKIRIVMNPTGGSFGWSMTPASYALAAVATVATGKPVELFMSYTEFQAYSGKRAPSYSNIRLAADSEGNMTAIEYEYGHDVGPYGGGMEWLPPKMMRFTGWGYKIPHILGLTRMAFTNHSFGTTYRGYGSPQGFTSGESMVDMLAYKAGMDPFEFRYKNLAEEGDLTPSSFPYREIPYKQLFDILRPYYYEALSEAKAADTPQKRRGVGVSLASFTCTAGPEDSAECRIELNSDGSVDVYNTWEEVGQGSHIGNVMHILESLKPLGLTPEKVNVFNICDTKNCPPSGAAAGSRSHMMNGQAIKIAAEKMLNTLRKSDGSFRCYDDLVNEGLSTSFDGKYSNASIHLSDIDPNTGQADDIPTYMYGVVIAEVKVDTSTGKTMVIGYTCAADVGVVGNILAVDGQAYGGSSHCIGFALSENYEDLKKHANMLGAGIPVCTDIPDEKFRIIYVENPRKNTPYGSSGCSEMFQSGGHVAVLNAIYNACGVRIYELPATPDKVKASLNEIATIGMQTPPHRYYLGDDFVEEIENILANPV